MVTLVVIIPPRVCARRPYTATAAGASTDRQLRPAERAPILGVMTDPSPDELAEGLRKRDRMFLVRLLIRVIVVVLLGVWGLLMLGESNIGGCAARGFESVTDEDAPESR
jgi:hypothetical protein